MKVWRRSNPKAYKSLIIRERFSNFSSVSLSCAGASLASATMFQNASWDCVTQSCYRNKLTAVCGGVEHTSSYSRHIEKHLDYLEQLMCRFKTNFELFHSFPSRRLSKLIVHVRLPFMWFCAAAKSQPAAAWKAKILRWLVWSAIDNSLPQS